MEEKTPFLGKRVKRNVQGHVIQRKENIKTFSERQKEVLNKCKSILDGKTQYHKDVDPP